MAKQYGSQNGDNRQDKPRRAYGRQSNDSEFVQLELSVEQKKALRAAFEGFDDLDIALADLLNDGTKVTVKYDDRNNCFVAFAFAPDDSDNSGYILTGRGSGVSRAVRELVFKHRDLLQGEWPNYHNINKDSEGDEW